MADFSIPGVNDKYKTNDLVNSLMEVERIPLKREQESIEGFRFEQESWRKVNQLMNTLRESSRSLFSYDNVFNNKLVSSSAETVLTAVADRGAATGSYSFVVMQTAKSDRFLSKPLTGDFTVEKGEYVFKVGQKSAKVNWNGGELKDFVDAVNKRAGNLVKMSFVGNSSNEKSVLVEALATGEKNSLHFEAAALDFAQNAEILKPKQDAAESAFGERFDELSGVDGFSSDGVILSRDGISVAGENAVSVSAQKFSGFAGKLSFKLSREIEDSEEFGAAVAQTNAAAEQTPSGEIRVDAKNAGAANSDATTEETAVAQEVSQEALTDGATENPLSQTENPPEVSAREKIAQILPQIKNAQIVTGLKFPEDSETLDAAENEKNDGARVFLQLKDGREIAIAPREPQDGAIENLAEYSIDLKEFPDVAGIAIKNSAKNETLFASEFLFAPDAGDGFAPVRAVSRASDAFVKFEGIEMRRETNMIDDIVPNLTLNAKNASETPVEITIGADADSAKNEIFSFIGNYNRLIAEFNILSQRNPEIISELHYFSDEEAEAAQKRLGLFAGDATLSREKSYFQQVMSAPYAQNFNDNLTMLSQIGISTKSSAGTMSSGSQLRGYLEIDEKKLDSALENYIDEVKNIFAVDTNGDFIADSGVAVLIEKNLQAYLQSGGILENKDKNLETKIKNSERQISQLERQLDTKENDLRRKYGQMNSALRRMEEQSTSISNFSKANSGGNE